MKGLDNPCNLLKKELVGRVFVWREAGNTTFHGERQSRPLPAGGQNHLVVTSLCCRGAQPSPARRRLRESWAFPRHRAQPCWLTGPFCNPSTGGALSSSSWGFYPSPFPPNQHTPHSAVTPRGGHGHGAAPPPLSFRCAPPSVIHPLILFDEPERMFQECFISR